MAKQGRFFEQLAVGDAETMEFDVTADVIEAFAGISGDDNPIHLDETFAAQTQFGGRIAHGMLSAAYISAMVGTRLPGYGAIYLSQSLRFRRPVHIGDRVTVTATIIALDAEKARATLETICTVAGKTVVEGEAIVLVPRRSS